MIGEEGGGGKVFKGHEIRSWKPVAIKWIDKEELRGETTNIDRERAIMAKLHHVRLGFCLHNAISS